jgi:hypothetical protein
LLVELGLELVAFLNFEERAAGRKRIGNGGGHGKWAELKGRLRAIR